MRSEFYVIFYRAVFFRYCKQNEVTPLALVVLKVCLIVFQWWDKQRGKSCELVTLKFLVFVSQKLLMNFTKYYVCVFSRVCEFICSRKVSKASPFRKCVFLSKFNVNETGWAF